MKLRGARLEDLPVLVQHGEEFWKDTRYYQDGIPYNPEAVEALCHNLIMGPDFGFILVLDDKDAGVVGFILVSISPLIFNPHFKVAGELAYYLAPDYRKGKRAVGMLQAAEAFCKVRGVQYITMVSMESSNPRHAERLYEYLGYTRNETSYTKEL